MFKIRMGIPEMQDFWDDLKKRVESGTASKTEEAKYGAVALDDKKHQGDSPFAIK